MKFGTAKKGGVKENLMTEIQRIFNKLNSDEHLIVSEFANAWDTTLPKTPEVIEKLIADARQLYSGGYRISIQSLTTAARTAEHEFKIAQAQQAATLKILKDWSEAADA